MSNIGKKIKTAGINIINKNNINKNSSAITNNKEINNNKNKSQNKNTKPNSSQVNSRCLLPLSQSSLPGTGLFFVAQNPKENVSKNNKSKYCSKDIITEIPNEKPYESIIPSLTQNNNILDAEHEAEKFLSQQLKKQLIEVTKMYQKQLILTSDAEFRAKRAENQRDNLKEEIENMKKDNHDLGEREGNLTENVESLTSALSQAKKEITRLQESLSSETERGEELKKRLEEALLARERGSHEASEEVMRIKHKLIELEGEKQSLMKIVRGGGGRGIEEEEIRKKLVEKDNIIESLEKSFNKAEIEKEEMKKRLEKEENLKNQLNLVIKQKNDKIEEMNSKLEEMKAYMEDFNKDMKWNQNKINQKESTIKLMKEKLKQKDDEINVLKKKLENMTKKNGGVNSINNIQQQNLTTNNMNKKSKYMNVSEEFKAFTENKKKMKNFYNNDYNIINDTDNTNSNNNVNKNSENYIYNNIINDNNIIQSKQVEGGTEYLIPVKAEPSLFAKDTKEYDYVDKDLDKDIFGKM